MSGTGRAEERKTLKRKCDGMDVDFESYHYCYSHCQYDICYSYITNVEITLLLMLMSVYAASISQGGSLFLSFS